MIVAPQASPVDLKALAVVAEQYPAAVVQRTGFLLEYVAEFVDVDVDLGDLHAVALQRGSRTRLRPSGPTGPLDERWNVIVNTPIEPDL
ncbi:MAG: hypothetical protein ABIP03_13365 [Aquihabitans sp.]